MFYRRRPPILFWLGAFFFARQLMRHWRAGGGYGHYGGYGRHGDYV
jgi:hypothetical protein